MPEGLRRAHRLATRLESIESALQRLRTFAQVLKLLTRPDDLLDDERALVKLLVGHLHGHRLEVRTGVLGSPQRLDGDDGIAQIRVHTHGTAAPKLRSTRVFAVGYR